MTKNKRLMLAGFFLSVFTIVLGCQSNSESNTQILHVSYDPTRELFEAYNEHFVDEWLKKTGQKISVSQSHGGSGKQARAVIEGLAADVVSLALAFDVEQISQQSGAISADWQKRLPNHSSPFYSTIVLLVRKGNPKKITDWPALAEKGVEIITPNPKTSGGARWNYLALWAYADKQFSHDEAKMLELAKSVFQNVTVFDSGARGAATTFVEREIGDVLMAWENDAKLILESDKGKGYEIVYPSLSVRAEPVVSVVDRTVDKRNTRAVSEAYLLGLYDSAAQNILVKFHFRSINDQLMVQHVSDFPQIEMASIDQFGGWPAFQTRHFADNGVFDGLLQGK